MVSITNAIVINMVKILAHLHTGNLELMFNGFTVAHAYA